MLILIHYEIWFSMRASWVAHSQPPDDKHKMYMLDANWVP